MRTISHRYVVSGGVPVDLMSEYEDGRLLFQASVAPIDEEIDEGRYRSMVIERETAKLERAQARQAAQDAAITAARAARQTVYDEAVALGFSEAAARSIAGL